MKRLNNNTTEEINTDLIERISRLIDLWLQKGQYSNAKLVCDWIRRLDFLNALTRSKDLSRSKLVLLQLRVSLYNSISKYGYMRTLSGRTDADVRKNLGIPAKELTLIRVVSLQDRSFPMRQGN